MKETESRDWESLFAATGSVRRIQLKATGSGKMRYMCHVPCRVSWWCYHWK
ncbi:hypothetical protein PRUPE_3G001900 [Prunus persica]|uniref:Uncharacterized protein n=1 Tax=Prunus persica TaxID=3760 RepID=A0A251PT64_PRUPE|nr:hypothetical protein PRUPE_3G001900 [Prunus persica]